MARDWDIRPAGEGDAGALALIGSATFLETFAGIVEGKAIVTHCARQHSAERYTTYLAQGAKIWLAETRAGRAPIGYAMLTPPDLPGARAADVELRRIYLLSRFHGSGLGAALMRGAVAAAAGFERLLLGVYHGNERAIAFYRKQGFVLVGERRFDVGGTLYDDIVFAKSLAA